MDKTECIDTKDINQLKFVRKFLSDFRGNFNEFNDDWLKHQTTSNVIHLLYDEIKSIDKEYYGNDD